MFEQRAACLTNHLDDIVWLYARLSDYHSRQVLFSLVQYWLYLHPEPLDALKELHYQPYFDLDLITCTENEVFVDLGAYIGDTTHSYLQVFGELYRRIYCYEIIEQNIKTMQTNLARFKNIEIRGQGVGASTGILYLQEFAGGNASRLQASGAIAVPVVTLDDDITEPITFLKMDIEGAEYDALLGAQRHIREDKPKLAVCLYHTIDDIWRLPRLIDKISGDYDFFLRYYGGSPIVADYVLYCIPR
jgi:FkbM family methyltransferase